MAVVNVGRLFVKHYGHRWKNANERWMAGKCCWGNCTNNHAGIYMGFPFCEHHWEWVELKIEEIYERERDD